MASDLTIRLLGGFDVEVNGDPIPEMHSRKDAYLLALLVLAQGRAVNRTTLAQTLWPFPDHAADQAGSYLRKSLWELRKALGDAAIRLEKPTGRTLRLNTSGVDIDLIAFDLLAARRDAASLRQAVALYRGPLLPDCIEPWAVREREARLEAYLRALQELSAGAAATGDYESAIQFLRQGRVTAQGSEAVCGALMELLARCGRDDEAIQEYKNLQELLRREYNAAPGAEITALRQRLRSTGRRPQAIQAPLASSSPPQRPLPQPLTPLIGREEAIREVQERLCVTRLMTLIGAGGVGKTRMALAVAAAVAAEYTEGVLFAELAALQSPDHVARSVAQSLRLREEPQRPLIQTLCDYLAHRSLLLVLDNCEHLLDACADLAAVLLLACPGLRLLATSRQPLSVPGETLWRVPSLSAPKPGEVAAMGEELTHRVAQYDAVRLFSARAMAQGPFQLTVENARHVAQICHLLDGIPLAIELAAARVRLLSPAKIVQGLNDRFSLLTGGSRTVLARHQTLWALIDWSHTLLTEPEQELLRRLSVFRGGFTLDAVEAVALPLPAAATGIGAEPDPSLAAFPPLPSALLLDLLSDLANKSLIGIEHDRAGEPRYALPETVRQFAHYQLVHRQENRIIGRRHRDYFLALAESAEPKLRDARQPEWLDRLEIEHDNLRAALSYGGMEEQDAECGLRLAAALWHFWAIRGYIVEGRQRLTAALELASLHSPHRARALIAAGILTDYDGSPEHAIPLLSEGLDLARQSEDRWLAAHALIVLGWVHRSIAPERAAQHLQEAEVLARDIGDRWLLIEALSTRGFFVFYHGDTPFARRLFEEGLPLCRELGDPWLMGEMVCHLGLVYSLDGEYQVAEMLLQESLLLSRELGDRRGTCSTLCYLGDVLLHRADLESAACYLTEGLTLSAELNYVRGIASALEGLAKLAFAEQRPARAARLMGAAEALRASRNAPRARLWQPAYARLQERVQSGLGEPHFSAILGQGVRMAQEQAIRFAMDRTAD